VRSVEDMDFMFGGAKAFNGDLSGWDVRNDANTFGMFQGADAFDQALSATLLERLRACDPHFRRDARWLWRLARRRVRPHAATRAIGYYWMGLAARPDAAGNAPRGAIQAFRGDF